LWFNNVTAHSSSINITLIIWKLKITIYYYMFTGLSSRPWRRRLAHRGASYVRRSYYFATIVYTHYNGFIINIKFIILYCPIAVCRCPIFQCLSYFTFSRHLPSYRCLYEDFCNGTFLRFSNYIFILCSVFRGC